MISEIFVVFIFYIIIVPVGLLLLNLIFRDSLKELPFFQVLGLSLIFGLASYVIILSIVGYFLISLAFLFGLSAISWLVLLFMIKKKEINYGNFNSFSNLICLIILLLPIIYTGYYLVDTPWHAADDARVYGYLTSLIKYYGRYTMTSLPFADIPLTNEIGVPVIAAYISNISGIQNGKAIMVAGALAISLIPIILYSIVFSLTKNIYLSLFAAMSVFNIYNTPYGMSIWSRFFSGNYGTVYGLFFLYVYIYILTKYDFLKCKNMLFYVTLNIFIFVASYFVYQGYILHMFLFTCILYLSNIVKSEKKSIENLMPLIVFIIPLIILSLIMRWPDFFPKKLIYFLWPILGRFSSERITLRPQSFENPGYGLDLSYFSQSIESMLVISLMIIAIVTIVYRKKTRNLFFYFYIYLSFIVVFYALSGLTTSLYFAPVRTALAVNHLTWLMLFSLIYHYFDNFILPKIQIHNESIIIKWVNRVEVRNLCMLFLCMLLTVSFLIPHITYAYPKERTWYTRETYFKSNFNAAIWLNEHASISDFILNDMSYTGYILLSMNIFNLTYADPITYFPGYNERAKELWKVWTNPYDEALIRNLLSRYNVTYILSDSDWKLLSLHMINESMGRGWSQKPFTPSEIVNIFDNYPFLDKVFEQDNTRIYKVLKDNLELTMINFTIVDDGQKEFWNSLSWGTGTIGTPIISSDTEIVKQGFDSLKIEIPSGINSRACISHRFDKVQDWSNYTRIVLDLYGRNTNTVIDFIITDSQDKAQRFPLRDNFLSWIEFIIPLNPEQGWNDWGRTGFPDLSNVSKIDIIFTPVAGCIWYIDNVELR